MKINFSAWMRATCCATMLVMTAAAVASDSSNYPTQLVKLVVPFPPGNASDTIGRIVSEELSKRLGQPVVVENRPGVSGGIGARAVANAAADGHTLLFTSTSLTINTALTKDLLYDVERDFDAVAILRSSAGMLLVVAKDFPADNFTELVELLKNNPDKYNYGHAGRGTIQHLTMESFLAAAGVRAFPIGYKGSVQVLTDMVGGDIDLMFDAIGSATPFIQRGNVRNLAMSSAQRLPRTPEIPTVRESGIESLQDWTVEGWTGLLAPKGTPRPVLERLNREFAEIMQMPHVQEHLAAQHMAYRPPTNLEEGQTFLREDMQRWQAAATAAHLEKE